VLAFGRRRKRTSKNRDDKHAKVLGGGTRLRGIAGDDDDDLVRAASAGDRAALDVLLRRHHDRLFSVCRRLTGDDADAADATQEALLAIVRGLASFGGRSRFSTWAYRIAVNASLDELRRRRRRPQPTDDTELAVLAVPVGGADTRVGRLDVDAALMGLTPEFRAVVVLRDLCGLDYAEIAEVLDIPPGTVRSRIARGRAALVPILGPTAAGPGPSAAGDPGGAVARP
jgi:RNA polymerase sigma-70 factor (ECF subfamily)